jgi:uncharacterized membrane protein YfcA
MHELILLGCSVGAGFLGAILGLGGGLIVVPVLTLFFGVDIRYAVAASLVSIVATSSGAAASFLEDRLTNLRLAVFLEMGTVMGAITGFVLSSYLTSSFLFLLFGIFIFFSALMMLRKREETRASKNHPWAESLGLGGSYPAVKGKMVSYGVEKVPFGLAVMYLAGILSALLGIGSGIFKVLAMDGAMRLPLKVSSATSNFMIGVTATASAGAYFLKGDVRPEIAGPVATGILVGASWGAKAMLKMPAQKIRRLFVVVLFIISTQMVLKGLK